MLSIMLFDENNIYIKTKIISKEENFTVLIKTNTIEIGPLLKEKNINIQEYMKEINIEFDENFKIKDLKYNDITESDKENFLKEFETLGEDLPKLNDYILDSIKSIFNSKVNTETLLLSIVKENIFETKDLEITKTFIEKYILNDYRYDLKDDKKTRMYIHLIKDNSEIKFKKD